jgi:DNA-binding transcriptional LysR family regulator
MSVSRTALVRIFRTAGPDLKDSMQLQELRYFLALAETLNFTRAAEICNVTQPALTRAIRRLEETLGAPLVNRERGNTHLTQFGRVMLPHFKKMLREKEMAERRARDFISLKEARLTVGLMCTIGPSCMVELFREFTALNSGLDLSLKDGSASEIEMQLVAGGIDAAIYCKPDEADEHVQSFQLFEEKFVVAISPSHPLARRDRLRVRDLDGHRYLWRTNCEYADYIDRVFETVGINVDYPYDSDRDDWIQCMVLAGLGFTLIPEFSITMSGLVIRPLVDPSVERKINLATIRGRPHMPMVRAFVDFARRYPWEEQLLALHGSSPVD